MNLLRSTLAAALLASLSGCYMEMYSDPIPIPASYSPKAYTPVTVKPQVAVAPSPATTAPIITQPPVPATPAIDDKTRDQIVAAARAQIIKQFREDKDPALHEYLTLVGSLLTINTASPNNEYDYVLLNTDKPIAAAVWPKTIVISKGLLKQMEDESELAGVLAREISNLASARYLKAADLPTPPPAFASATRPITTHPAPAPISAAQTPLIQKRASELVDLLLKPNQNSDLDQAADLEGARLAAAARYAPDGYLRLLTRQMPATANSQAGWDRIKSLSANVEIITKAFPHADVRLPARFETYVKTPPTEKTARP